MRNTVIRDMARDKGVRLWEIAERLNMYDGNFSRKLRKELPSEEQDRIMAIIEEICLEHRAEQRQ